eukprot:scaffold22649_cov99-Cylindrotheca_fusiformis.AAC.5
MTVRIINIPYLCNGLCADSKRRWHVIGTGKEGTNKLMGSVSKSFPLLVEAKALTTEHLLQLFNDPARSDVSEILLIYEASYSDVISFCYKKYKMTSTATATINRDPILSSPKGINELCHDCHHHGHVQESGTASSMMTIESSSPTPSQPPSTTDIPQLRLRRRRSTLRKEGVVHDKETRRSSGSHTMDHEGESKDSQALPKQVFFPLHF